MDDSCIFDTFQIVQTDIPDIIEKCNALLKRCFQRRGELGSNIINNHMLLINKSAGDQIRSMATIDITSEPGRASIWNVCASAIGKNKHSTRIMLEHGIKCMESLNISTMGLLLEYENAFWSKALSLYTSLGFVNVTPWDEKSIRLVRTGEVSREQIEEAREQAQMIIMGSNPYENRRVIFSPNIATFGQHIMNLQKEYTGFFIVVDEKVVGIGNLSGGNLILPGSLNFIAFSEIYNISVDYSLIKFHTHPNITTDNNNLLLNPPSFGDITHLLSLCGKTYIREYVFTRNGMFALGLTRRAQEMLCGNKNDNIKNEIVEKYKQLAENIQRLSYEPYEILKSFAPSGFEQGENILIDYFIEDVLSIEANNVQIFDIKYWTYNFLKLVQVSDVFFISHQLHMNNSSNVEGILIELIDFQVLEAMEEGESKTANKCILTNDLTDENVTYLDTFKNKKCFPYSFINLNPILIYILNDPDKKEDILINFKQGILVKNVTRPFRRPRVSSFRSFRQKPY